VHAQDIRQPLGLVGAPSVDALMPVAGFFAATSPWPAVPPRSIYQDTGPIARVVVDCADPRARARFWG